MKAYNIPFVGMAAVLLTVLWASPASAFQTYSIDGSTGNCASCHGDFRAASYQSRTAADSVNWGMDLESGHGAAYNIGCAECHSPSGRSPVYLNPLSDPAGDADGLGCVGCHGRIEDITPNDGVSGGPGPNWGDGLRANHASAGVTTCAGCHSTDSVQVGEDVPPETFLAQGIDACDENGAAAGTGNYGNVGLDNDGDGLHEPSEPDCAVNQAPVADPNGPYSGIAGVALSFDGSGSSDDGTIVAYSWDFGDGTGLGTGVNPTHTYGTPGTYTVSLTVTDDGGLTDTATTTVTIGPEPNLPPVAVDDYIEIEMNSINSIPAAVFLANDIDPDGDPLSIIATCCAVNGEGGIDGAAQLVGFFPIEGFTGIASISYQISDGVLISNLATITFNVLPPPDPDGDGVLGEADLCPDQDATGFDADIDGCIDTLGGLGDVVNTLVGQGVIDAQMQNSLLSKMGNAEKSSTKENICAAVNELEAFKNQVNAQRGKKISDPAADLLTQYANNVIVKLLGKLLPGEVC